MALPEEGGVSDCLPTGVVRYCGRDFPPDAMARIRELIASEPKSHRLQLSRRVCELLDWRRIDGRLKDMSCRVAMLRMDRDGLITLPPPITRNGNGRSRPRITGASDPREAISLEPAQLRAITLEAVTSRNESSLWNELIERYHYLGHKPLPGEQIRYLVRSADAVIAALGFGAAAWKVAPRDRFIGWTPPQRKTRLHFIVNHARFLILPWVHTKNLASCILARAARQLPHDWRERYSHAPLLLETFVERDRFRGTCYRAANWIHVGATQGRGKLDVHMRFAVPVKEIFLYPLHRHFRREMCAAAP